MKQVKKIKVKSRFSDKFTGMIYAVGMELEFDDDRANDVIERGLAEAIEEQPSEDVNAKDDEMITEAKEPGMKVVITTEPETEEPEKEPVKEPEKGPKKEPEKEPEKEPKKKTPAKKKTAAK